MYKMSKYSRLNKRSLTRDEYEAYHEYNTYTNDNDRE